MDIMKAPEVYLASNLDGMISDNFAGYIWSIKMKARNYIGLMILTSLLLSGCQATPYFDDAAEKPWGEYLKGALDFAVAIVVAVALV